MTDLMATQLQLEVAPLQGARGKSQNRLVSVGSVSTSTILLLPTVMAAGPQASKRYFEFFTVTIRNEHTRSNYFRACRVFFAWCKVHGLTLESIGPIHQ